MVNKTSLIFIGIILISFVLRFYTLSSVPNGLEQDETSIGYNAYSLLQTGRDEHGEVYPLYFKAFGEYKLPGYVYASIPSIALFGVNAFAVRLPAALAGVMSVILVFFLVRELFPKRKEFALVSSFVLAITPWHLHFSRGAFEVSLALMFLLCGIVGFFYAKRKKSLFLISLSVLGFLLSMYTYNITRILAPVLLILLFILFAEKSFYNSYKKKIYLGFLLILLTIPFTLSLFTSGGYSAAKGTLITSSAVIKVQLLELRSYYLYLPQLFTKVFFNQHTLTVWQYLINVFSYLSVDFYFLRGSLHGNHGLGNVGQFYLFTLPFFVTGIVLFVKEKSRQGLFILGWIISTIAIASLTREAPHGTRGFFLVVPFCIAISYGILFWWKKTLQSKKKAVVVLVLSGFFVFAIYNIVYYFTSYYVRFPIHYAQAFRSEDHELARYLMSADKDYDQIVIDESAGLVYISLLFYQAYPPDTYHSTAVYEKEDSEGFVKVLSYGKYRYKDIDWNEEVKNTKTLFVTTTLNLPENAQVVKTFYYPTRPVFSALGQEIVGYTVSDIAYVVAKVQ